MGYPLQGQIYSPYGCRVRYHTLDPAWMTLRSRCFLAIRLLLNNSASISLSQVWAIGCARHKTLKPKPIFLTSISFMIRHCNLLLPFKCSFWYQKRYWVFKLACSCFKVSSIISQPRSSIISEVKFGPSIPGASWHLAKRSCIVEILRGSNLELQKKSWETWKCVPVLDT